MNRHPLPTPAADDQPGQQRRPLPRSPLGLDPGPVLGDPPLVGVVLLPGDVRRDLVRDQGQVFIGRHHDPPRPPPSWLSAAWVGLPPPEAVIPGVDRVVEDVTDGLPGRGAPLELAAIRTGVWADPEANVVGDQVAEDFADRAEALELVEHHADDRADLFVGVEIEPPDGRPDVSDRRTHEDFTAGDLVEEPLPHPAAEEVQLGLGHDPREPEQEPVVVIGRVVEPILVGEQHAKHRTQFNELMPVLARAGQPAHLQAEDQPDVVEADLGEQSLKAQSSFGRGPALALIVVDDENAVRRPTELDGPIDEPVLAVGGFLVLGDLLGGGLADVDDGQPVEMPGLDLGSAEQAGRGWPLARVVGSRVNGSHG